MTEGQIKKCPKCGGELEKGVMQLGGGGRGSDVVFWGRENIEEKLFSRYFWQRGQDLQAWRCKKCQLATFLYGENKGVRP
jgi:predicted nucleic-acid-binding Zn-ribbon protein